MPLGNYYPNAWHIPCSLPEKLGIIGELMSRLEPNTLKYYVDSEKQSESESDRSSDSSSGDDSDTSGVQEDESSASVNIL